MNKKIITIVSSIAVILIIAVGFFFFQSSGKNSIKAEHDKYLALINDTHDFNGGLKALETLDNDKGQEAFKNIKTEIKIAKELKNADSSLDNKDVDSAKKSIDKVDSLTTDNSFDKAIEWLKEDITNYEKALKEIKEAKSEDINSILDKYKFKHSALKVKLNEEKNESKSESTSSNSNSSISDNENIPRVGLQQTPLTYGELKRGAYNNGGSETVIGKLLSEELGGPVANFSNEQIRDAIARYNQKHPIQKTENTSGNPLETYYSQWVTAIKREHPEASIIKDTDGRYYVEGLTKNRVVVVYENPHLVRLVNATTNVHVEF